MTAHDRDDDDDLSLAGMRSLWKSMPDEEPSNNGLAALMAAAREKAEEMKPRESWWQRVLVQLRRPPVLALATVVLLVGGGVIIAQRDDMKATATSEDRTVSATAPAAGSSTEVAAGEGESDGAGTLGKDQAPPPAAEPATGMAVTQQPADVPEAAPVEKLQRPLAKPAKASGATAKSKPKLEEEQRYRVAAPDPAKPAEPEVTKAAPAGAIGGAPPMSIAVDDTATAAPAPVTTDSKVAAPSRRTAVEKNEPTPSIDALIKQCEATAARGDCAGAKSLASKIEKADPKAYRARVLTNAAIKACF